MCTWGGLGAYKNGEEDLVRTVRGAGYALEDLGNLQISASLCNERQICIFYNYLFGDIRKLIFFDYRGCVT